MLATRATDHRVIVCYVNLGGGQDELVFDGGSIIINERGELIAWGKQFEEDLIIADLNIESVFQSRLQDPRQRQEKLKHESEAKQFAKIVLFDSKTQKAKPPLPKRQVKFLEPLAEIYQALVLGPVTI